MHTWRMSRFAIILGILLLLLPVQDALAQSAGTPESESVIQFIARPKDANDGERFSTELEPGRGATLTLVLENPGTDPINIHAYSSNVGVGPNGGLAFGPEGAEPEGSAAWMQFPPTTVLLNPGENKEIPFTIDVPDGTPPGEYVNAVAAETVDSYEVQGSTNFRQRLRKVLAVYIYVPGPRSAHLELGGPSVDMRARGPVVIVPVENSGNERTRVQGTMTLHDSTGTVLATETFYTSWLYGGHATTLEVPLKTVFPPGEYAIDVELTDESKAEVGKLESASLRMPDPGEVANPVTVKAAEVTPNADPIQFASVSVTVGNAADTIRSSKIILVVTRDGEAVEDFVLSEGVPIPRGETTFQQRYIPLTGFDSGTYTFSLVVQSVERGSDDATLILQVEDIATLEVP